jgi:hypothetical protein
LYQSGSYCFERPEPPSEIVYDVNGIELEFTYIPKPPTIRKLTPLKNSRLAGNLDFSWSKAKPAVGRACSITKWALAWPSNAWMYLIDSGVAGSFEDATSRKNQFVDRFEASFGIQLVKSRKEI